MNRPVMPLLFGLVVAFHAAFAAASCWAPAPQASRIVFSTTQAGAPFQGTFRDYGGLVCIDAGGNSHIRVSVNTASVDTQLPELDTALRGPDFFDTRRWPQALFESETVRSMGQGRYQVTGKLTLRDVTHEVNVPFTFTPAAGGNARLEGRLSLERLDYHIGLGQWADTRWVGNQVEVTFSIVFKPVAGE
ncbi:MAG TPA: YceI family protein [Gammaproteobacteria bacterium]|nr:YceI family protein [Gammaproteobacteria bacterium]